MPAERDLKDTFCEHQRGIACKRIQANSQRDGARINSGSLPSIEGHALAQRIMRFDRNTAHVWRAVETSTPGYPGYQEFCQHFGKDFETKKTLEHGNFDLGRCEMHTHFL